LFPALEPTVKPRIAGPPSAGELRGSLVLFLVNLGARRECQRDTDLHRSRLPVGDPRGGRRQHLLLLLAMDRPSL